MNNKKGKILRVYLKLAAPVLAVLTATGAMLFASSGIGARAKELFWSSELPELIISAELGAKAKIERLKEPEPEKPPSAPEPEKTEEKPREEEPSETEKPEQETSEPGLVYRSDTEKPETKTDEAPETAEADEKPEKGGRLSASEIEIKNKTDYSPDIEELLNSDIDLRGRTVLIIHSHATEAYMPSGEDDYVASDPFSTLNGEQNVVKVGEVLKAVLEARGVKVIHDTGLYDYPNYNVSYSRALTGIKTDISEFPEIGVVIDLHRDALEGKDGTVYKTVADVCGEPCAQVGFVVGTNASGLKHPNWEKNLAFALKVQYTMCDKYPSLARPIKISRYRYNQHMTEGSLILEVGCTGNSLKEAIAAVKYFGDCLADVLTA